MPDSDFGALYELLQISPNADVETINRVFENTDLGDPSRFLPLNQARVECLLRSGGNNDFVITNRGVDYLETHPPSGRILCRLLKAAESAGTPASVREELAGADDGS